ncbi:calcium/sodium antiporter [Methylococcus sp. EFPC2]|uniref:calcium/sodium antiporter n=1 Tax=Methylococcus sp. EFPC2 TaxID=2812648 RepID=UPI0019682212|nr:calcium/sodium antiporter [Methylococcus sp. EFPC2]QSA98836.1 calcium/sodium antiporter [Methylococcus sp. EFPC2]
MLTTFLLIAGLVLLVAGAEFLVRGAAKLAVSFGISPLVVGLTVVAFGTSSPELAVSVGAAFAGEADIAVGNVVGSNIFNILFILGLSALVAPLFVAQQLIRLDVPIMIGISLLLPILGLDGRIGRLDGLLLFTGVIAYTVFLIRQSRRENRAVQDEYAQEYAVGPEEQTPLAWGKDAAYIAGGVVMLVLGSRWLVSGAVSVAEYFGVSELVIGLTIVAMGTSLPEVATSVVASLKGERDIAVGNVVGSNIFNILAVVGLTATVAPGGVPVALDALRFDIPVMIMVALACLPIFVTHHSISRWEGGLFLAYYLAYFTHIVLASAGSAAMPKLDSVVFALLLPLTALIALVMHRPAAEERA